MRLTIDTPISSTRALIAGVALVAPGILFLVANALNDAGAPFLWQPFDRLLASWGLERMFNVVSPLLFLGGPALACLLNFLAIGRVDFKWEPGHLVGTVAVNPRAANLLLLFACGVVLAGFLGYAFVENYRLVPTHV